MPPTLSFEQAFCQVLGCCQVGLSRRRHARHSRRCTVAWSSLCGSNLSEGRVPVLQLDVRYACSWEIWLQGTLK